MVKIEHVICPVDLSTQSGTALRHAAAWAAWYDAWLHVLHVAPLPQPMLSPTGILAALPVRPLEEITSEVERFVAGTIGTQGDPIVDVVQGQAAAAIVEASTRPNAVLVMGTHGWSGLDRLLLGSVAERVAHTTHCPLLVVPPHAASTHLTPAPGQILCAVDFLPSSLAGLRYGLSLAQEAKARLEVVTVLEEYRDGGLSTLTQVILPDQDDVRRGPLQLLREHVPDDARLWCDVQENVIAGPPADSLLKRAEALDTDLIVMGTGDRFHLHAAWLGSTTGRILRSARCPVLIVPPPERITLAQVIPIPMGDQLEELARLSRLQVE
jgi:nucleotide-binding universal stress UspA family protein